MTFNGWLQIAVFSLVIIAITRPLGGYMTRVFNGERTFLHPVLRPIEHAVYWCCGVDEKQEQHWLTYGVAFWWGGAREERGEPGRPPGARLFFFSTCVVLGPLSARKRRRAMLPFN